VFGLFLVATPIAIIIGSPVSGLLLNLEGWLGLHGWQSMFIIEGIPSILLGFVVLKFLPDGPKDATWLADEERSWLLGEMARETKEENSHTLSSFGAAMLDKRIYAFGIAYVGIISGLYGIILWLPQIVKGFGLSNSVVGFVTAIPYCAAALGMVYWSRHSDRTGERPWHVAGACFLAGFGLALSAWITGPAMSMVVLVIAAVGVFSAMATFWALPTSFLSGAGAAVGIAAINSIGNLGGFSGPYVVGYIKDATGSFSAGMLFLSGCIVLCGIIVLSMYRGKANAVLPNAVRAKPEGVL
jgi:ACS family tartrate transporter-like MFS transporter